jgi:hypothetical protein
MRCCLQALFGVVALDLNFGDFGFSGVAAATLKGLQDRTGAHSRGQLLVCGELPQDSPAPQPGSACQRRRLMAVTGRSATAAQ